MRSPLPVRILLLGHALVTLVAAFVLMAAPGLIPSAVGIVLEPTEFLVPILLGAAEFGVGLLSLLASSWTFGRPLAHLCLVFAAMHLMTAFGEGLALSAGVSPAVGVNLVVRVIVAALFVAAYVRLHSADRAES
jgi:hypothetical protein